MFTQFQKIWFQILNENIDSPVSINKYCDQKWSNLELSALYNGNKYYFQY